MEIRGASFRDVVGADLEVRDVRRMLKLDETLFVEHQGAEPKKQLAKAVCSFANQLGGCVLVNVSDGEDPHPLGSLPTWVTNAASPVDAVRDRLEGLVDPMPPFEARTFAVTADDDDDDAEPNVLVVRVYESADTPHITSDGAIFVRGVAQDRRKDPIYRPALIENQQALRALMERGERSRERVAALLRNPGLPLGMAASASIPKSTPGRSRTHPTRSLRPGSPPPPRPPVMEIVERVGVALLSGDEPQREFRVRSRPRNSPVPVLAIAFAWQRFTRTA